MSKFAATGQVRYRIRNALRKNFALWHLYRRLCVVMLFISLSMWIVAETPLFGSTLFPLFLVYFLWVKTICMLLIWYLFRTYHQKGLYFYYHFGLSEIQLFIGVWLYDIGIFLAFLAVARVVSL